MGGMNTATATVDRREQKQARHELRKAQTLDLLAEVLQSQTRHGKHLKEFHDRLTANEAALVEQTRQQLRLSGSFWERMKWLATGQ